MVANVNQGKSKDQLDWKVSKTADLIYHLVLIVATYPPTASSLNPNVTTEVLPRVRKTWIRGSWTGIVKKIIFQLSNWQETAEAIVSSASCLGKASTAREDSILVS